MMVVELFTTAAIILTALSSVYLMLACYAVMVFARTLKTPAPVSKQPGVTVFKPVYGTDYQLKQNLISFYRQTYPDFQILFGVQRKDDPAIPIIQEVIKAHRHVPSKLVIGEDILGANRKVSNLMHMVAHASHDIFVISDSDMRVDKDYLSRVISAFDADFKGLVTCLYKATPAPGWASILGAMFINHWFLPSALIPATFGPVKNCFGATMAVHRDTLESIGGLKSLVGNLADDYILGKRIRDDGRPIMLAPVVVDNVVEEENLKSLYYHELRWARTIRAVEPLGYASTFLTDAVPWGVIASLLLSVTEPFSYAAIPFVLALPVRILLVFISSRAIYNSSESDYFLIIPRDLLSFAVRIMCYTGRRIRWRDDKGEVSTGGALTTEPPANKPSGH